MLDMALLVSRLCRNTLGRPPGREGGVTGGEVQRGPMVLASGCLCIVLM